MWLLGALSHLNAFYSLPAGFTIHLPLHAASEADVEEPKPYFLRFCQLISTGEELVLGPQRIPL